MKAWLYNGFFVAVLPFLLWAWAEYAVASLPPAPQALGLPLLAAGGALMAWAITTFMFTTGHAPSNAIPSVKRVVTGPFRVLSDPIYTGFVLMLFGAAAYGVSVSGFWLVAPSVALGAIALVFGHEALRRPALANEAQRSLLSLPDGGETKPTPRQLLGAVLQIGFWLLLLEVSKFALCGTFGDARVSALALVAACATLVLAPRVWTLRRVLIGMHAALVFVAAATLRVGDTLEYALCLPLAAVGGLIGAFAVETDDGALAMTLPVLTLGACLGLSGLDERGVALALAGLVALGALPAHHVLLRATEAIANSWSAVRIGPIRIINYAWCAFAAAAIGAAIFIGVVGQRALAAVLIVAACVVVSAGLWGQLVEFSGKLARPFGYYGALIGAFVGVGAASVALDLSPWLLGAGLVMGAPIVQAIGRLRCLVQGCCHGARCAHARGIVYRRTESRVLRIAKLGGVAVHPTPLYSIYANAFALIVLWRLAHVGATQTQIIAVYLIVSGALRFIEEAYRGEPQTPVWQGLKLYQWLAIAQLLAGVVISTITSAPLPPFTALSSMAWLAALGVGLMAGAAMGVDFPSARTRFSQLTPAE